MGYYSAFCFSLNNMTCYGKDIISKDVISLVSQVHVAYLTNPEKKTLPEM